MKLRIRGNSLRLRVTRSEAEKIRQGETVRETIRFSPDGALAYTLEGCPEAREITASFSSGWIRVRIPAAQALQWASGSLVGLSAQQPLDGHDALKILIEKDFTCLQPVDGEDDSDAFARPEA